VSDLYVSLLQKYLIRDGFRSSFANSCHGDEHGYSIAPTLLNTGEFDGWPDELTDSSMFSSDRASTSAALTARNSQSICRSWKFTFSAVSASTWSNSSNLWIIKSVQRVIYLLMSKTTYHNARFAQPQKVLWLNCGTEF
jgi:hypothetical protein